MTQTIDTKLASNRLGVGQIRRCQMDASWEQELAYFHSRGKIPVLMDVLKMQQTGSASHTEKSRNGNLIGIWRFMNINVSKLAVYTARFNE